MKGLPWKKAGFIVIATVLGFVLYDAVVHNLLNPPDATGGNGA